jgi:GT2 family glycosyltransferase
VNISAAAVIVNYNGKDTIRDCLDSLKIQSVPFTEIIIVDNSSPDSSWIGLEDEFPGIKVLRLSTNSGFPSACNTGIQHSCSEFVAILNNDIRLDPDWLKNMFLRISPDWDFWASRVIFAESPDLIDSAGDGMTVIGAAYKTGHKKQTSLFEKERETFGACAAAALYRRNLLDRLDGFDEDFFLIYEDADLSFRARLIGGRCLFVPDARVYHRVNYSIGTFSHNYVFYGQRNSEYVFWKNMPTPMLLLYLPERILFSLMSLVYFSGKGRLGSFLKAKADFLKHFSVVLKKRKKIQQKRKISCKELRSVLDRNWIKDRL